MRVVVRARGARECSPLTAEGLVGAAFGIVYARLLRGERGPLGGLVGELTSLIVLPYLGPAAARRELARAAASLAPVGRRREVVSAGGMPARGTVRMEALGVAVVTRCGVSRCALTLRTARVLDCIGELPGASNRMVAERAGVADPGQISKLLGVWSVWG